MRSKLYYENLYDALYMMYHFDIKIVDWLDNDGTCYLLNESSSYKYDDYSGYMSDKFYVHIGSVLTLYPKEGDIIFNGRDYYRTSSPHDDYIIVQRNNKPFINPIKEAS